jgi:hypothetical protein
MSRSPAEAGHIAAGTARRWVTLSPAQCYDLR